MIGLPYGEETMTICKLSHYHRISERNGQNDGETEFNIARRI